MLSKTPYTRLWGGGSDAAINSLAQYLDTFMLWGEPLKDTKRFMARVRSKSKANKQTLKFSLSTRPILVDTESKAWEKAETIHKKIIELRRGIATPKPSNVGSQRLLSAAAKAKPTIHACGQNLQLQLEQEETQQR